jgi:hypothetical protein
MVGIMTGSLNKQIVEKETSLHKLTFRKKKKRFVLGLLMSGCHFIVSGNCVFVTSGTKQRTYLSNDLQYFFEMKQDFNDIESKIVDRDWLSDLMNNFTVLSNKTFLLINCHVWVAFAVCFKKFLMGGGGEEYGVQKNSNGLHVACGRPV